MQQLWYMHLLSLRASFNMLRSYYPDYMKIRQYDDGSSQYKLVGHLAV